MRLPRIRVTLRRLMLFVLLVAIFVGGWQEYRRFRERMDKLAYGYAVLTHQHNYRAELLRKKASRNEPLETGRAEPGRFAESVLKELAAYSNQTPEARSYLLRLAEFEEAMGRKYLRACEIPWLPVTPDPDPPAPQ